MSYYTYLKKGKEGKGISCVFTNIQRLVDFDEELNYHTLLRVLSKEKRSWWEDPYRGVVVIKSYGLERGKQRIVKGPKQHNRNI
jgi:hypothetical protein